MYERIETDDLKFTTRWVGAFIAEVSSLGATMQLMINYKWNFETFWIV